MANHNKHEVAGNSVNFLAKMTRGTRLIYDLIGIVIALALFLFTTLSFDLYKQFTISLISFGYRELDKVIIFILLLSIALTWFAYRRWQELQTEITERERVEATIKRLNRELESRVVERTIQLERANQKLAHKITEHKQTEEALQQAEQRYHDLFEEAPLMYVITHNQAGQPIIADCNQLFLATLGYRRDEVLGYPLADFYTPASQTKLLAGGGYQRALTRKFAAEERELLTKTGQVIETLLRALPETDLNGQVIGTRAMFVDITERKQAEEEIYRRNSELILLNQIIAASAAGLKPEIVLQIACRELALAFELPRVMATLLNEERTATRVVAEHHSPGQPTMLGQTFPLGSQASIQYLFDHKAPLTINDTQNDPGLAQLQELLGQRGATSALILPIIINGEVIGELSLETQCPRSFSPEEISLGWSVTDQVAGALARARLNQNYQRLTTVIEQSVESVIITDPDGEILYVNPAFEQTSGYSQAEVLGQNARLLRNEKQEAAFYETLWETLSNGQVWQGRLSSKKKDGSCYTEDAIISPVRDQSGAVVNYVEIKRDVTRELQLEEQYRQAQRMEAVGQLAGGIAHDFNNLLTVINGYSELLQYSLSDQVSLREYADEIKRSGKRAAALTGQLLAFSRKQVLQPKILDLNMVVADIDKLLGRLISEDIELVTVLTPDLTPVKVDPGQLEQVLLNLAVNARDAMPNGGKLTIKTAQATLDQVYADQHNEVTPGEYVMLTVSDTGVGMTEEVKARIFEPFFTTKEVGKGTGLGLATCFGIIKQSGGHIGVYSEPGQGATFKVYLPCAEAVINPSVQRHQAKTLPRGTETILLVEDGAAVRALTAHILQEQGYTVLEAADGQEALYLTQQVYAEREIHLLLTDVVMPQMSGRELANRLSILYPKTKVLFTSGYTDDAIIRHGILEPGTAFLEKPFTLIALAGKVREVLDKD